MLSIILDPSGFCPVLLLAKEKFKELYPSKSEEVDIYLQEVRMNYK